MSVMQNIGYQLRSRRLEMKYSVMELSVLAKVSASYIYSIETGDRGSHLDKLWRITQVLELSLDDMCRLAGYDFNVRLDF